jgi:hypothetical protein
MGTIFSCLGDLCTALGNAITSCFFSAVDSCFKGIVDAVFGCIASMFKTCGRCLPC